jgi:hypothetical protein
VSATELERLAKKMTGWTAAQWREWYGIQADHIERMANTRDPEVRYTLSWSLPWFRSVQYGVEPPVLPPKLPPRRTNVRAPWKEVEGAIAPPRRAVLRISRKAPAMKGMSDVLAEE